MQGFGRAGSTDTCRRIWSAIYANCRPLTNSAHAVVRGPERPFAQHSVPRWRCWPRSGHRGYINLLEISFQVPRVPAYTVNRGKRLVKAPKLLWTDTGLAAHLAGLVDSDRLVRGREWGFWLESWVGNHLLAWAGLHVPRLNITHSANGREVDFVIETGRRLIPVEVKATPRSSSRDLAGLNAFLDTYEAAPFGVVACPCPAPKVLSSRAIALPLNQLLLF